ncbi:MAG: hypothetical protein JWS12_693 [Candidatus Saccharibacteria bacterium]|nr:hypothetical protein [Candidatus Saccharibacteria bacterium]
MAKYGKKLAAGALVAGAVGYVAGILTAPKSGKETRQDIQKAAAQAKTEAEKQLKKLHSELTDLIDQSKTKANEASSKAKAGYSRAVGAATEAQQKARELLSALHDGGADNKDLQKAIKEGSKALNHLKSYLTK